MDEKTIVEQAREIPVRLSCDVLVVGGGTAGVVAALASARSGAETVLVERYGSLGGALINGATALHSFFNLFKAFNGVEPKKLVRGIPDEIVNRMVEAGGCLGHVEQAMGYDYDSFATCFDHEVFKRVIDEMLEEAEVRTLLHTMVVDTVVENEEIQGAVIESKSGREALLAKVFIDASGDGDVAARAGVPFVNTHPDRYGVSLTFGMGGVDLVRAVKFLDEKGILTQLAYGDKGDERDTIVRVGMNFTKLPEVKRAMEEQGMWGPLTSSLHGGDLTYINCTVVHSVDSLDIDQASEAEVKLRRQVALMAELLVQNVAGFEKAYVSWTSIQIGVRRTRVIECEHDISLDEIQNATRFSDEVALYGFHDCAPRIVVKDGGAYGIPYRALVPKRVQNLLVAGRMITSDWDAHMSTRNTVCCMAQGQAVGTAAAMCAQSSSRPRKLSVIHLRERLREDGVYLGD